MDVYNDSLLLFWESLNKNHVAYIMVGGFAVNMHGYMRATKDADMWVKDSLENRQNLRKAFLELGYGDYESLETMGITVPFLHLNQLLANKKAVSRPKDQLDVIELEKIKEERRKMGLD